MFIDSFTDLIGIVNYTRRITEIAFQMLIFISTCIFLIISKFEVFDYCITQLIIEYSSFHIIRYKSMQIERHDK